jgi:hypothetical protein
VAQVFFELTGKALELGIGPSAGEQSRFRRRDIELALEMELTERGAETGAVLLEARTVREVSAEAEATLRAYADAGEQHALRREEEPAAEHPSEPHGIIFRPLSEHEATWLTDPPESFLRLSEDVGDELRSELVRLVQLLRWRFNRPWPANPLSNARFVWSLDEEAWHSAPRRYVDVPSLGDEERELNGGAVEALQQLLDTESFREPLGRQVLLEAIALADDNPRAALVLAVAAAEVGLKQFVADASPSEGEGWLISNVPSPPLATLMQKHVPFFVPDKRAREKGSPAIPKAVRKPISDAVELRNKIVHSGAEPPTQPELAHLFVAVNDLLYLLDWFRGHDWAYDQLTRETRERYA